MNARQRCRERRQMHYRDQSRIRTIRLSLLKKRSTEEIINNIWREPAEHHTQEYDVVNLLASFKNQVDRYPTDSINNRCLPKAYLYTVRSRYRRRRRRDCFTSNGGIYVKFWEITAFCPLCKSVFKAIKAKQHLNNEHPEATPEQRNAVHRLAKFALITCKTNKKITKKITINATDVIMQNKHCQKYTGTVSGGAFGQGK